jgi:ABC-type molybdate transport system substrate-binding protein
MNKPFAFLVSIVLLVPALCAPGQGLDVFADQSFRPALQEIVPLFTEQTGFEVQLSLGISAVLAERIRSDHSADLFFPASDEIMGQMMEKGLVDVALKRNILILPAREPPEEGVTPEPQYISAAVMAQAAHRLQAMAFLEFLTSETARGAFARQGFALP